MLRTEVRLLKGLPYLKCLSRPKLLYYLFNNYYLIETKGLKSIVKVFQCKKKKKKKKRTRMLISIVSRPFYE